MNQPRAVLDLGSNSTRYLLYSGNPGGFVPGGVRERGMTVTRISEEMETVNRIGEPALARLWACLEDFDENIRSAGGGWCRGVATSAFRRAENGPEVLDSIQTRFSIPQLDIISGESEARLTARGALRSLNESEGTVLDIGGSSTELVVRTGNRAPYLASFPLGVVRMYERSGCPTGWTKSVHDRLRSLIDETLAQLEAPESVQAPLIVVGGTGTTFAALELNLSRYRPEDVHGFQTGQETVTGMLESLYGCSFQEFLNREPVVAPGREDVLFAGLVILESVLGWTGLDNLMVSDFGLLAGVLDEELR